MPDKLIARMPPPLHFCPPKLQKFISFLTVYFSYPGMENSKSLSLLASPSCSQLIQPISQAEATPTSSEDLPFLCTVSLELECKLNKTCLGVALGFPLDFCLGNPRNPALVAFHGAPGGPPCVAIAESQNGEKTSSTHCV